MQHHNNAVGLEGIPYGDGGGDDDDVLGVAVEHFRSRSDPWVVEDTTGAAAAEEDAGPFRTNGRVENASFDTYDGDAEDSRDRTGGAVEAAAALAVACQWW